MEDEMRRVSCESSPLRRFLASLAFRPTHRRCLTSFAFFFLTISFIGTHLTDKLSHSCPLDALGELQLPDLRSVVTEIIFFPSTS